MASVRINCARADRMLTSGCAEVYFACELHPVFADAAEACSAGRERVRADCWLPPVRSPLRRPARGGEPPDAEGTFEQILAHVRD